MAELGAFITAVVRCGLAMGDLMDNSVHKYGEDVLQEMHATAMRISRKGKR